MNLKTLICELNEEAQRNYCIKILSYEMSRYHLRKLDFHRLLEDVTQGEFIEESEEYMMAESDSASKFENLGKNEFGISSLKLKDWQINCKSRFNSQGDENVKLLFFKIFDDSTWEPYELELSDKQDLDNIYFSCEWSNYSTLRYLKEVQLVEKSSNKVLSQFTFDTVSFRAIAYDAELYCAVFDENDDLELGVFNTKEHDIAKELYAIEK